MRLVPIAEKHFAMQAESVLALPVGEAAKAVALLGKAVGPPWGADQKNATLAAMIALAISRQQAV